MIDWYLDEYIRFHPDDNDWWLTESRYRDFIQPKDVIYVWKAKSEPPHKKAKEYFYWLTSTGRTGQVAGIFATGEVRTSAKPWPVPLSNEDRFQKYRIDHPWAKLTPENDSYVLCTYKDNYVRNPLLQETIWGKLGQSTETDLGCFKVFRNRRLVKLEPWEANIINSLLAKSQP